MAHSEAAVRAERMRAKLNTEFGAQTEFVGRQQVQELCPELDMSGGGRWPVLGASYHPQGAPPATTGWSGRSPKAQWNAAPTSTRTHRWRV